MGFLDDALDTIDDAVDSGTKFVAKGLQKGGHLAGEALDEAGLQGAGQTVSGWGDDIADDAGLKVAERNLDQSDDPKELLHGDAKKLTEVAGHLQKFHDAFDKAGQGLTRLDTDHWTGQAAENFRRDFDPQPKQWLAAADAFAKAGTALTTYAHTVGWAQDQAKEAVRIWKEAKKKSDAAAKAFLNDAMTYDLRLKAYNATPADQRQGDPPAKPGEFTPPADAVAQFKEAEDKLDTARTQRDSAARTALAAVKALVESAPAMPSRTEILKAEVMDTATSVPQLAIHFGGGVVKSVVDLNKLLRSVNPLDPYNITHPAEYATGLSGLVAGLGTAANNPAEAAKGLVGSGWGSDPAEAAGKLFGNLLLAPETGGGSVAATAAEREATAVAENAAKNTAKEAAENTAKETAKEAGEKAAQETADKASGAAKEPVTSPTNPAGLPEGSTTKNYAQEAPDTTTSGAANAPSQKVPHLVQPALEPLPKPSPHPDFVTGPVKPTDMHPSVKPAAESDAAHEVNPTPAEAPKHSHPQDHADPGSSVSPNDSQTADHAAPPKEAPKSEKAGETAKTPEPSAHSDFATGPVKPEGEHSPVAAPGESSGAHGADATSSETPTHSQAEGDAGTASDVSTHDSPGADHTATPAESPGESSTAGDIQGATQPGSGPHMSPEDFRRLTPEDQMKVAWSETSQGAVTFRDILDAKEYGANHWNQYATELPQAQKDAIWDYTGAGYKTINPYLRSGDEAVNGLADKVAAIDGALAGHPLPEPLMVSRATDLYHIPMGPERMAGHVFTEDAFTSASLGPPPYLGKQAILNLRVPEGTPGLWVEKVSRYGHGEQEILLGRGIKWRCDRVVISDGLYQIFGEVLP